MSSRKTTQNSSPPALQLARGLAPREASPCVLTIGTYDGLHVGHRALIAHTCVRAAALGLPAGLLTFEPMPREVLQCEDPPARLTSLRERWRLLSGSGLTRLHVLAFNQRLRLMSGAQFMGALQALGARAIVVGHDFRFGHKGAASAQWCASEARNYGFEVDILEPVLVDGERVSSGLVRGALAAGDLERAARLLGRPYSMRARVRQGERLGRTLGFPTANMALHRRRSPLAGIYAVRVRGAAVPAAGPEGRGWPAVASLGTRPTVNGTEPLLETHLFDFAGDLYGAELEVEFVARLREERRFESLPAMVAQMHLDAAAARAALAPLV
jgi:riboflavin kinase / FMN adenylyltransferase